MRVRIAAVGGALFSVLTIVAGTRVLTGVAAPDYVLLPWLVWYNTAAGAAGVAIAAGLWSSRRWAIAAAATLAAAHGGVLVALIAWRAAGGTVADQSLVAMTLRTLIWSAAVLAARRVPGPRV